MKADVLVFADDLSGGGAVGAEFVRHSLSVVMVSTEPSMAGPSDDADVLIIDTWTRHLPRADAGARVAAFAERFKGARPHLIVKKIDTLLRGNVASEIDALSAVFGSGPCLLVAAAPDAGRTTVEGIQRVDGIPLAEALEELDPLAKRSTSHIPTLLTEETAGPVSVLRLQTVREGERAVHRALRDVAAGIVVADTETQDDLLTAVRGAILAGFHFFAGSYGIGDALAAGPAELRPAGLAPALERILPDNGRPVLIVVGSQSAAAYRQLEKLRSTAGCRHVTLAVERRDDTARQLDVAQKAVLDALDAGADVVVSTAASAHVAAEFARHEPNSWSLVDHAVATLLTPLLPRFSAVVATGGDTARSLLTSAGSTALRLGLPEVMPGTPVGTVLDGALAGYPFLTKPGSFGGDDALVQLLDILRGTSGPSLLSAVSGNGPDHMPPARRRGSL